MRERATGSEIGMDRARAMLKAGFMRDFAADVIRKCESESSLSLSFSPSLCPRGSGVLKGFKRDSEQS